MARAEGSPAPAKQLSPPRCRVVHAWVTDAVFAELEHAAQQMRQHPDRLVADLITVAVGEKIVPDILGR